jgi:glycylpeptide N-tetradecanoyltransferase
VFNALALMENEEIFDALKFAKGDGVLHYYVYNWKSKPFPGKELAAVLM